MEVYTSATTRTHEEVITQLRIILAGQLVDKINNNGISQGSPLSAQLFAIHIDEMLKEYDNALPVKIKQTQPETYGGGGGEFGERKVNTHLWRYPNTNKRKRRHQPP